MKKSDAAHLHVLSAMTADPTKAARAMLDTGKKHLKMTRRQISLNTLEKLVRKQLGTVSRRPNLEVATRRRRRGPAAWLHHEALSWLDF